MGRNRVFLNEPIFFVLHLYCEIVALCDFVGLLGYSVDLELFNYFSSLGFFLFYLRNNFSFVTLFAQISELSHGLVQHWE